jgi:hypothetical protein
MEYAVETGGMHPDDVFNLLVKRVFNQKFPLIPEIMDVIGWFFFRTRRHRVFLSRFRHDRIRILRLSASAIRFPVVSLFLSFF